MEGYRTATLDLKRRNRSSAPHADAEEDVRINLVSSQPAVCRLVLSPSTTGGGRTAVQITVPLKLEV